MTSQSVPDLVPAELFARAGWTSVVYLTPAERPPVVGLLFKDRNAAASIFALWRGRLGEIDVDDVVRIAVIQRDTPFDASGYDVHISAGTLGDTCKAAGVWCRVASDGIPALRRFQVCLSVHRRYLLLPAVIASGGVEYMPYDGIGKQHLIFRYLSEVALPNDPDAAVRDADARQP